MAKRIRGHSNSVSNNILISQMSSSNLKLDRIEGRVKKMEKKLTTRVKDNKWYTKKQGNIESPYE